MRIRTGEKHKRKAHGVVVAVVMGLSRRRKIPVGEARRRETKVGEVSDRSDGGGRDLARIRDGVAMVTKSRTDPVSLLTD